MGLENARHFLNRVSYRGSFTTLKTVANLTPTEATDLVLGTTTLPLYDADAQTGTESAILTERLRRNTGGDPMAINRLSDFMGTMFPARLPEADARTMGAWFNFLNWAAFAPLQDVLEELPRQLNMVRRLNNDLFNENFGREYLELFSLGVGNYTEIDMGIFARLLSGWFWDSNRGDDPKPQGWRTAIGAQWAHVQANARLSEHFGEVMVVGSDIQTDRLLAAQLAVSNDAIGYRIIEKFLRFYGKDKIEQDVLEHFVQIYKANNLTLEPVLRELLRTEWFYSTAGARAMSPWELFHKLINYFEADYDPLRYVLANETKFHDMGQPVYDYPEIAGWKADFSAPHYGKNWFTAGTIAFRYLYGAELASQKAPQVLGPIVENLGFEEGVEEVVKHVLAHEPDAAQLDVYKTRALGGSDISHWDDAIHRPQILRNLANTLFYSHLSQVH